MTKKTGAIFCTCLALLGFAAAPHARADTTPLAVQIVTVQAKAETRTLTMTGEVAARDLLSAAFPISGRISKMKVGVGDHVSKGQILAAIDSVQQEQALRSAQVKLDTATADATKAQDDASRQEKLLAQGATTRSARDAAANALAAARAVVAQARADLAKARRALADTVLTAPASGTVTDKLANVGEVVGAAKPVLKLALGDTYDAIFQVPEVLLTRARNGPVTVRLSPIDNPEETVIGTPRLISPIVNPKLGTVKVTVAMPSLPRGMQTGAAITGTIQETDPPHIILPWSSIAATASGPAVWVVDPKTHTVSLRQIRILRYETLRIVVAGGLKDGEEVVGLGADRLYPGRLVRKAAGF